MYYYKLYHCCSLSNNSSCLSSLFFCSDVDTESVEKVNSHFANTIAFIQAKAQEDTRFAGIAL